MRVCFTEAPSTSTRELVISVVVRRENVTGCSCDCCPKREWLHLSIVEDHDLLVYKNKLPPLLPLYLLTNTIRHIWQNPYPFYCLMVSYLSYILTECFTSDLINDVSILLFVLERPVARQWSRNFKYQSMFPLRGFPVKICILGSADSLESTHKNFSSKIFSK